PIIDAYLDHYPAVSVNLVLLDRNAHLVDEGVDIALRVAELPDSSMVAVRVGGDVKRVVVASPRYLAQHPRIAEPADLTKHRIVTTTHFGHDTWIFPPAAGGTIPRAVHFTPRLGAVRGQRRAGRRGGGRGRPWRDPALYLSRRRAGAGRLADAPPARCRTAGHAGSPHHTRGSNIGAQGSLVPGLRGAPPARRI